VNLINRLLGVLAARKISRADWRTPEKTQFSFLLPEEVGVCNTPTSSLETHVALIDSNGILPGSPLVIAFCSVQNGRCRSLYA
jgi:hypothetical protein